MAARRPRSLLRCSPAVALTLAALAGCGGGGAGGDAGGVAAVHTGQRWRFAQGAAPDTEQVYRVERVEPDAVVYTVRTVVEGRPPSDPVELRFPRGVLPATGDDTRFEVGDRTLPARVREEDGARVTRARDGEVVAFPGVVRVARDGRTQLELVAIEEP